VRADELKPDKRHTAWRELAIDSEAHSPLNHTQGYVAPIHFAWIYAGLNEVNLAIRWLEKAYEDRNSPLVFIRLISDFDPVRSDPRFADLLKRMNPQPRPF
jgi:hypothetical protein